MRHDELVGRSMATSPGDQRFASTPETGRHRTGASVRPSSGPPRPRPVRQHRSSTGFAGTRLAARPSSRSPTSTRDRAKPGGTLLTPTPARPSCRSPFDPIEGEPPGEGTFAFPAAMPKLLPSPGRLAAKSMAGNQSRVKFTRHLSYRSCAVFTPDGRCAIGHSKAPLVNAQAA